jgi:chromosome segregation ATPase
MGAADALKREFRRLSDKLDLSKARLKTYDKDMDDEITKKAQLKEQLQIYQHQIQQMSKSHVICSMNEYKETKELIKHTHLDIILSTQRLEALEVSKKSEQELLDDVTAKMASVRAELQTYGRVYEFRNDD